MRPAVAHRLTALPRSLDLELVRAAFAPSFARGGFWFEGADYALLGAEATASFRADRSDRRQKTGARAARVVWEDDDGRLEDEVECPFEALRARLRERAVPPSAYEARPLPLLGGAVGYIGYEAGQMIEAMPSLPRERLPLPDVALFFHDWIVGRHLATGEAWLSVLGRGDTDDEAQRAADAITSRVSSAITEAVRTARGSSTERTSDDRAAAFEPTSATSDVITREHVVRDAYLAKVTRAKELIEAGEAFEICLTRAIDAPYEEPPEALFGALRARSPAPFAALLEMPEGAVVSSSPERFLSLDEHGIAESRPIKGTRPRGTTPEEDERLARELATSPKDRAENLMIVDLTRNDLGRVCRYGSVEVTEMLAVERYATVHQLVSTVRGELARDRDAVDLVRACFPPGSMTGAPKIEAMRRIEELEPTERGPYAGALGYFDFGGALDLSVVIRTAVVARDVARLHVGGAIVADSIAEDEHAETVVKARAVLGALADVPRVICRTERGDGELQGRTRAIGALR